VLDKLAPQSKIPAKLC